MFHALEIDADGDLLVPCRAKHGQHRQTVRGQHAQAQRGWAFVTVKPGPCLLLIPLIVALTTLMTSVSTLLWAIRLKTES